MPDNTQVVDVKAEAENILGFPVLAAQRKGVNTLILWKLDAGNGVTFDPKERNNRYCLKYIWHLSPDSPLNAVQGSEVQYFPKRAVIAVLRKTAPATLFDVFNLF